jgi:hypothetical protein
LDGGDLLGVGKVKVQVLGSLDPAACKGGKGWDVVSMNNMHGALDLDSGGSIGAG